MDMNSERFIQASVNLMYQLITYYQATVNVYSSVELPYKAIMARCSMLLIMTEH